MQSVDNKAHWENVYQTKSPDEVSWYQPVPITSLQFLTDHNVPRTADVDQYVQTLAHLTTADARVVMGTFSEEGPTKCSGLPIQQYSETSLSERLLGHFNKLRCISVDHITPFNTVQNFLFCSFQKRPFFSDYSTQ
jgi:hypothetical protein